VGFVVNLRGEKTHQIVRSGLEILVNLMHRGACGCDPLTGDGAGILTQIPHDFFASVAEGLAFELPAAGEYGVGTVFLPPDAAQREFCARRLEEAIAAEGQSLLGWRDVPIDNEQIGPTAREVEPLIRQVFIARGRETPPEMFEWKLFVVRKLLEGAVAASGLSQRKYCYVPTLSSRIVVYKGLMLANQVERFYGDLADPRFVSALALVHQRYSTNTFPTWELAQPFRYLAHNGEINTLRGNVNWMHARQSMLASEAYGADLKKILPICTSGASDSAIFDNVLELLVLTGRSLPRAMSMLIPEPWAGHESMSDVKKAYYEYQSCLMEPWDGPASMAFTDGTLIGAVLDRNGLRPSRYWVTKGGLVIMASEAGVLDIPPGEIESKGRLRPGRMFLVDLEEARITTDDEIKDSLASRYPYREWLNENQVTLDSLADGRRDAQVGNRLQVTGDSRQEAAGGAEEGTSESDGRRDACTTAQVGNRLQVTGDSRQEPAGGGEEGTSASDGRRDACTTTSPSSNGQPAAVHQTNGHGPDGHDDGALLRWQRAFGYTLEDLRIILTPMALDGYEPVGSMGNDTPLAVLSDRPQLLYNYFKQLFAQVTNPPLDAIREEIVTSLITTLGSEGNLLVETPGQCRLLRLDQPILTNAELEPIKALDLPGDANRPGLKSRTLSMLFSRADGPAGMERRMQALRQEASQAIAEGVTLLILSDRGVDKYLAPIPALLATSGVHHHLIREETRTRCGLIVETGDAREVQHFSLLTGYGAGAVNPYLVFETLRQMQREGYLPADTPIEKLKKNFIKAVGKGLLKVMSKMGISTQQSYRGAQIFEAIGLNRALVDEYFTWTASRIGGVGIETIAEETLRWHELAYPTRHDVPRNLGLDVGGQYQWRRKGEAHLFNPEVVAKLQHATRINSRDDFKKYCELIDNQERQLLTLRGLLELKPGTPVPLDEVEPAANIVKRFATGAMSYGSISKEAHETLAVAMNRIGGKSNTGEGGEDPVRFVRDANGDLRSSAIKQVASGRFGVTSEYLTSAQELQIKMAQGAKPGEGGQLPGHKVDKEIGRIRHSTPGVGLISPPPHHDIYSIEDLSQLIHDLKNANRHARISVKLVAEVGVGTVAAGVAKGKSDVVLISGHDGGTGASPYTSIKHAGIPWELGLAETHQVLVKNALRGRIIVQTDGQLRTPRDIAIATLLGAEEWGIASAALVTLGCIMMRKCHLNTCPVGVATQDPVLRAKFAGKPEYVVNFFFLIAEGLREIMAQLGFRTINEMVGHVERLDTRAAIAHWKARGLDFSAVLHKPDARPGVRTYCAEPQDHGIDKSLDMTTLLERCRPALERKEKVVVDLPIRNVHRTVGTILSSEITKRFGRDALDDDTIELNFKGTAGQSLLAFGVRGVTVRVEGDVNDYCAKGLSGGKVIVCPPREATFVPEENIIAGNVVLYGATSGEVYLRGVAGERFCVRNSGASAVVEGVGDHGCEYMTGGVAVILGETGRNFAAGMSGGVAFVLDEQGQFPKLVNLEMVELQDLSDPADQRTVYELVRKHVDYTQSGRGRHVLENWPRLIAKFVKVMPLDYKRALAELRKEQELARVRGAQAPELQEAAHG
ncbi:MAG TPA: glutamate synthase large subunit, partial [Pirellulales bacterium]|nr:glutamate synthase large subunit [Pirellulales bacterium]